MFCECYVDKMKAQDDGISDAFLGLFFGSDRDSNISFSNIAEEEEVSSHDGTMRSMKLQ